MKKHAILILAILSCSVLHGMEVYKVNRKNIYFKDTKKVMLKDSEILSIFDDGEKVGEARLMKIQGKKAKAYLLAGTVESGFQITSSSASNKEKKSQEDSTNYNDQGEFAEEQSNVSPFTRGESIRSSSRFKRKTSKSSKSVFIETEVFRDLVGIRNIKVEIPMSSAFNLGFAYYNYNVKLDATLSVDGSDIASSSVTIGGSSFNLLGSYFFNGRSDTDGWYIRGEFGYTEIELDSLRFDDVELLGLNLTEKATGTWGYANAGYHWQWQTFYMNLFGGVQSARLKNNSTKETVSATGVDFGLMMGVAF